MAATSEGTVPNFNETFTELYLGQIIAMEKCTSGD
jgi:hypothetical protein